MLKYSFYKILIAIFIALVAILLISTAYTKFQQRKIYFELFEDAHVKMTAEAPIIKIINKSDDFTLFFDVKDIEQQLSKSFKAFLSAQQLNDVKYLDQYFSSQALDLFSDKVIDGNLLLFLNGSLDVDFVQQDGSLIFLSGKLNFSSTSAQRSNITHATMRATVVLKKFSFNYKISNFIVDEEFGEPRKPRKLSQERFDGVNYYPAKFPWSTFWGNFDGTMVEKDFELISSLNANSVRIFLTYEDFKADKLQNYKKLIELLEIAKRQSLRVMVTLFDLKPDYSMQSIHSDVLTLLSLVEKLEKYDFDIIFDLKNEVDLDFKNHERWKVELWLGSLLYVVSNATDVPVTIGWSNIESAQNNLNDVDVISYHDYNNNLSLSEVRLEELRADALNKPIYVTEVGETSAELIWGFPSNDEKQALKLKNRIFSNSAADGIAVWTLFDFVDLDDRALGKSPWLRLLQKKYGIINQNYQLKPAARVVREFFSKNTTRLDIE